MATVWSAIHETLGRPVAVKFIHAQALGSETAVARFMHEARVAAAIQHRFVVDIFDFGKTEQGEPYMVMELLNGESLADRITRGPPIPLKTFIRMMEQCLTGLEAVHAAGIIHRDLKPENVFLIHDSDGGFPKLLDFGISRMDESVMGERATRLTREGAVLGTPWYMSPEQVRGKSDLDHRTDLYSMGVMLYEVLSGTLPLDSETVGDLMVKIATEEPEALAIRRPVIPRSLSEIVARAMAKSPSERFPTAKSLRLALRKQRQTISDDLFTVVMGRASSEPPLKLGSGDLVPAKPPDSAPSPPLRRVSRRPAATLAATADDLEALPATVAPDASLPSTRRAPRRAVIALVLTVATGAAAVAAMRAGLLHAPTETTNEGSSAIAAPMPPVEEDSSLERGLPVTTAVPPEQAAEAGMAPVAAASEATAMIEADTDGVSTAVETAETTERQAESPSSAKVPTRRRFMRAAAMQSPTRFDDPGF